MNDIQVLEKCIEFGRNLRHFRNKFLGLLPIINKKRLYIKKGFSSVFTFAFQIGGVSENQVKTVLSLYNRFYCLPALRSLLVNGKVGANKLVKVASIACRENESELCSLLLKMPYKAIETIVRDYKSSSKNEKYNDNQSGFIFGSLSSKNMDNSDHSTLYPPVSPTSSVCPSSSDERLASSSQTLQTVNKDSQIKNSIPTFAHSNANMSPKFLRAQKLISNLNEEVLARLNKLLEKGLDLNEILTKLLDQREAQIHENIQQISQNSKQVPAKSRYIPAPIRRIIREEKGTNCSHPNCSRPANIIHHTNRFALTHRHDPNFLAPLCKEHHQIAHFIDAKFQANSTPP
jgi:hypothetical protein